MKILAVDYGASRTGLAVCDPTEFLTTPITPQITLKARPKVAAEVCRIAQEQKAELIVVGHGRHRGRARREEPQAGQDFADLERPARADVGRAAVHL